MSIAIMLVIQVSVLYLSDELKPAQRSQAWREIIWHRHSASAKSNVESLVKQGQQHMKASQRDKIIGISFLHRHCIYMLDISLRSSHELVERE